MPEVNLGREGEESKEQAPGCSQCCRHLWHHVSHRGLWCLLLLLGVVVMNQFCWCTLLLHNDCEKQTLTTAVHQKSHRMFPGRAMISHPVAQVWGEEGVKSCSHHPFCCTQRIIFAWFYCTFYMDPYSTVSIVLTSCPLVHGETISVWKVGDLLPVKYLQSVWKTNKKHNHNRKNIFQFQMEMSQFRRGEVKHTLYCWEMGMLWKFLLRFHFWLSLTINVALILIFVHWTRLQA